MMFWIRAWFGEVKRIGKRRGAYILVATRVPDKIEKQPGEGVIW